MSRSRKVTGIILSGGKSSRMGTEKGLVEHKGKRLIEYPIEALQAICDQLVISSNKDCYSYLNIPVVADEIKDCGPIGGIYSCMKAIKSDFYAVISCDVPNVPEQLFLDMLSNIMDANFICPIDDTDRRQPLISIFNSSCLPIIEKELLSGNYKMMELLDLLNGKSFIIAHELAYYSSKLFLNANSPKDINAL